MTTFFSYVNLLGCVFWLIICTLNFPPSYYLDAWKHREYWPCFTALIVHVIVLSGIYLFFARRRNAGAERLQRENDILAKRIEQFKLQDKLNELQEGPDEI